jgi:hypothetical protein
MGDAGRPPEPGRSRWSVILRAVIIDAAKEPRLQLDQDEAFAIESCEVQRDIERSTLTNIVRDGVALTLPPGARVTLYTGPNVVFVGKAVDELHVLDLLSTEADDDLSDTELI